MSPTLTLTLYCANNYDITEVAAPTNPQFIKHADASLGFMLPTYVTTQNTGCPPTNWIISAFNYDTTQVTGLPTNPVLVGSDRIVKPLNAALHQGYIFFIKVVANGVNSSPHTDSVKWMGPYELRVGCYYASVTFTNSPAFTTSVNMQVGDSRMNIYQFVQPSSNRDWCIPVTNQIVQYNGEPWAGTA